MTDGHVLSGPDGTVSITPGALTAIVQRAAESVDGVRVRRRRRGLELRIEGERARVELSLAAPYGARLPQVARGVQQRVTDALEGMCGLDVEAVDVSVDELEDS
jgi:uncharacterized alkaline shock family protein YloU